MHWTHEELHLCVSSLNSCPVVIERLSGCERLAESAAAAKEEEGGLTPGGLEAALPPFCILNINYAHYRWTKGRKRWEIYWKD